MWCCGVVGGGGVVVVWREPFMEVSCKCLYGGCMESVVFVSVEIVFGGSWCLFGVPYAVVSRSGSRMEQQVASSGPAKQ